MQLTRLDWVKSFMGIESATTSQDALLKSLIEQVSDQVQSYCNRTFALSTYRTWMPWPDGNILQVREWPIIQLYGVSRSEQAAASIQNASAKHADVSCDDSNLYLHSIDAAGAEASTTLSLSTNLTIQQLVNAVGSVAGWTASAYGGFTDTPTQLIKPFSVQPATANTRVDLVVANNFEPADILYGTERQIRLSFFGTLPPTWTRPVVSPLYFPASHVIEPPQLLLVWYRAGYTLPAEDGGNGNLPPGLVFAVNTVIKDTLEVLGYSTVLKSESLADHSWTMDPEAVRSTVERRAALFTPYRGLVA